MIAVWRAMTWHYLRQVIPMLGLMILVMILGPLAVKGMFLLSGLSFEADFLAEMSERPQFYFNYLPLAFLFFAVVVFSGQDGIRQTSYAMPISNTHLAMWHLILAALSVTAQNVTVLLAYDALFQTGWPILEPTLLMIAGFVLAQGLAWSLYDFSFRRLLGCGLVFGAFVWWCVELHFPGGHDGGPAFMGELSWVSWLVLAGVIALGGWLATRSLGRHRRRDTRLWSIGDDAARKLDELLLSWFSPAQPEFADGLAALRWNEWRRGRLFGIAMGLGMAVIPVIAGIAAVFTSTNYQLLKGCLVITCWLGVFGGLVSGQVICMSIWADPRTGGMSTFFATAPVSDRDMGRILLRNVFWSNQLMWLSVMVLGLAIPTTVLLTADSQWRLESLQRLWQYQQFGNAVIPITIVLSALAAWVVAGSFGSLSMTGRNVLIGVIVFSMIGAAVVGTFIIRFLLPEAWQVAVAAGSCLFCGLAASGFSLWMFRKAFVRQLITAHTILIAAGIWLLETVFLATVLPFPPVWRAVFCLVASLTVTPLASAPLAVAWNRHRP